MKKDSINSKDDKDLLTNVAILNDLDKAKLNEVIADIQMKDESKQRILNACTIKSLEDTKGSKIPFWISGMKAVTRQAALPALAVILAMSIVGYNILVKIKPDPIQVSTALSSESYVSKEISDADEKSQSVYSMAISPITGNFPKWFSPGMLVANKYFQNFLPGTKFENTLSSDYIYVNAEKDAIFKTGAHKNCRNFRFNVSTGNIECIDHFIRAKLIAAKIMQETDKIYFRDCPPSDEFALIDIRTSRDAYKSSYRFNLKTGSYIKITDYVKNLMDLWVFKDYSTMITVPEFKSKWEIYLVDILSGKKKNIVTEANATDMFGLSSGNGYLWYSLFKNGNKKTRCIYNTATGAKKIITTDNYPFFTPDDRFVIYYLGDKIRRLNLESNEDIILVKNASHIVNVANNIVAYDEANGKLILSATVTGAYIDIYSLNVNTGKMVHIIDSDSKVSLSAQKTTSVPDLSTNPVKSSNSQESLSFTKTSFTNFSLPSKVPLSSPASNFSSQNYSTSYVSSQNYSTSYTSSQNNSKSYASSQNFSKSYASSQYYSNSSKSYIPSSYQEESQYISDTQSKSSLEELPQPEPVKNRGACTYIFDKNGKYIFYYTDLHGKGGSIYCYDIASGAQFAVPLPTEFIKKLAADRRNILHPEEPSPVQFNLYLSDDATHIYLTYEIHRMIYSDSIPLSKIVDYAKNYNTIIHFGKYFKNLYYGSDLPGRSYTSYTDDGKVAILNENYGTRKFALILFDKAFDNSKPYGGGQVLVEKNIPDNADWGLADWWNHKYESGTVVYNLDNVISFVKTHDSLNGFTKIFSRYSIGYDYQDSEMLKQNWFFYQICVGPNEYVNVIENYKDMKVQIQQAGFGEALIYERPLNSAIKNSSRLPK